VPAIVLLTFWTDRVIGGRDLSTLQQPSRAHNNVKVVINNSILIIIIIVINNHYSKRQDRMHHLVLI
jgi:hypothetical protein